MSSMSKSSVHRICQKGTNLYGLSNADVEVAQSHKHRRKPGPKPKLSARDKRVLLRTLHIMHKNKCHITVMSLVKEAGLDPMFNPMKNVCQTK